MTRHLSLLNTVILCGLMQHSSNAAPATSKVWWPRAKDSAQDEPIVFAQAEPDTELPERDSFKAGPSDSAIKGRLVYLVALSPDGGEIVFRHFNVPETVKTRPLWTDFGVFRFTTLKISPANPSNASFLPSGNGLDLLYTQGTLTEILAPRMAPIRWDFETGDIRQTPPVLLPISPRYPTSQRPETIALGDSHARSRDGRLWAYWYQKEPEGENGLTPPLAALAISSTNPKDEILGLPVDPAPQQGNAAWTNRDTLLYDYSAGLFSTRQYWFGSYDMGYQPSRDYTYVPNSDTQFLPPHWWPAIYQVDPLPFRRLKSAKGRVLIANAFAPIPSPDGRFIAFCGWGRDTPVPEPKPGQKPEAEPSEPRWWVWDRKAKKRTLIGQKPIFAEQAKWTPDSRALIFLPVRGIKTKGTLEPKEGFNPAGTALIEGEQEVPVMRLDVAGLVEGRTKLEDAASELGRIHARAVDYMSFIGSQYNTLLRMRGLTRDGKFVLADVREWENRPRPKPATTTYPVTIDTIHALRLSDKSDQTAAKLEQAQTYDWFDMSQPTP